MALQYKINRYNGAEIDSLSNQKYKDFFTELENCINTCTKSKINLIWLTIQEDQSILISIAISLGFNFHHCNSNSLILVHQLKSTCIVPNPATHYVGTGGVVLSNNNEVLLVSEKQGHREYFYKLPGGNVEINENIKSAVLREIFEETNIKSTFIGLCSVAHLHKWCENRSNLYFICLLQAKTFNIVPQKSEIKDCIWLPIEKVSAHKKITDFNKSAIQHAMKTQYLQSSKIDHYIKDINLDGFNISKNDFEYFQ